MQTTAAHPDSEPTRAVEGDFRQFLQSELVRRCRENPAFSLRSFARLLDTDPSSLAKILKSKRPIGQNLIRKLGERLGLSPDEIQEFLDIRKHSRRLQPLHSAFPAPVPSYARIQADAFRIIADWHHYAILELLRLDQHKSDSKWAARALGISVHEVNEAVDRLQRAGLLEISRDGRWKDASSDGRTTNISQPYFDAAHRRMQRQILEKAVVALESVPVARRDQSSITMAIDTRLIPEAKRRITRFRRELAQFLSRGERRDNVYQLSISLYPVTHLHSEEKNEEH